MAASHNGEVVRLFALGAVMIESSGAKREARLVAELLLLVVGALRGELGVQVGHVLGDFHLVLVV